MTRRIHILFFFSLLLLQACCDERFTEPSPLPQINFVKAPPAATLDTAVQFTRIYALNGNGNLYESRFSFLSSSFQVPLALGANATTYIFEGPTSIDTLTLAYDRQVEFVSRNCGAYLSIKNIRISEPTSFSNVRISTDSAIAYRNYNYNLIVVVSL